MQEGFVPALGTPLDDNGYFLRESYVKQIEDQLARGAVGLLSMGSMGIQAYLRPELCPEVARAAVETAAERVPVFVGAMDCSVAKVKARMAAMEHLPLTAFVLTAPVYNRCTPAQMITFFREAAAATRHGLMLYDLPGVTQSKITYEVVKALLKEAPNLMGIKSADLALFRQLKLDPEVPEDFIMVCSNLDLFDLAYCWGLKNSLDGMLTVTPANTEKLFRAMKAGDFAQAAGYLKNIVALRDFMAGHDLWPSYTAGMNLLGYAGSFGPDYVAPFKGEYREALTELMRRIGEPVVGS